MSPRAFIFNVVPNTLIKGVVVFQLLHLPDSDDPCQSSLQGC